MIKVHSTSCEADNCPYPEAWAFRRTGGISLHGKWLCDICWGFQFGDAVCSKCERGCYADEDWDSKVKAHICGACSKNNSIDNMVENEIDTSIEQRRNDETKDS